MCYALRQSLTPCTLSQQRRSSPKRGKKKLRKRPCALSSMPPDPYGHSLPIDPHELCRERSLELPCQRCGVGSVPCPLMALNEALPAAFDLAGKVNRQR